MKESRVSKMEKRLRIHAVSEKVNEHGHVKRNEIHARKCDFLIGLNLDSLLSLSGNTADDHDTICSAFLEEKIEGRQALQKAVWIPQTNLPLALHDKTRPFALAHCRDPSCSCIYTGYNIIYRIYTWYMYLYEVSDLLVLASAK
jgi:hypothetical protein